MVGRNGKIKQFRFELFLKERPGVEADLDGAGFVESVEGPLFDAFQGDVTPGIQGGVAVLYCAIEGASLGQAIDKVVGAVRALGLHPARFDLGMESA